MSQSDVYTVLAAPLRRQLLVVLQGLDTEERISTLARNIADETGSSDAEQIHSLLYHAHIPKMAAAGIVNQDVDENTVKLTEEGQVLATVLTE